MRHLEPALAGLFLAAWLASLVHALGLVSLAGTIETSLQGYYLICGAIGWLVGNIYMGRRRSLGEAWGRQMRRRLLTLYTVGPAGLVFLVWSMEPAVAQQELPAVPFWALGVMAAFFLVPVVIRRRPSKR